MKTPIAASDLLGLPARPARSKRKGTLAWILGILAFAFVLGFGKGTDPVAARILLALTAASATLAVVLLAETFASLRGLRSSSLAEHLPTHAALEEEKKQILTAIKELDFDHAMGKVDDTDYETLRTRYEREALRVLKAIDEEQAAWREKAEALAREHLETTLSGTPGAHEARPAEAKDEGEAAAPQEARACPSCKTANDFDARFCKKCGSRLPGPKTCGECQTENDADAEFCTRCGTKLEAQAPTGEGEEGGAA